MSIFNLSLDDLSQHPNAGLNFEAISWCDKLIKKYPNIKIDLFVPTRYARLNEVAYRICDDMSWVRKLKGLPDNYRVCLHGLYHRRSKRDFSWHTGIESNNNEWESLTYKQAEMLLDNIEKDFRDCGVRFRKVFRPPGWHIGKNAVKLLKDRGYIIAGNQKYGKKFEKLSKKWVAYNYDLVGKIPSGNIVAYGHTSDWTNNYFNEDKCALVCKILSSDKFEFKFLEEI